MLSRHYPDYMLNEGVSIWNFRADFTELAVDYVYSARTQWLTNATIHKYDRALLGCPSVDYVAEGDNRDTILRKSLKEFFLDANNVNGTGVTRRELKKLHPQATLLRDKKTGFIYISLLSDEHFSKKLQTLPYLKHLPFHLEEDEDLEHELKPHREAGKRFMKEADTDWANAEIENIGLNIVPVADFSLTMLLSDSNTGMFYFYEYLKGFGKNVTVKPPNERARFHYSLPETREHITSTYGLHTEENIVAKIADTIEPLTIEHITEKVKAFNNIR